MQTTYRPRNMRGKLLGRAAYERNIHAGVLTATGAQIAAEFGDAAIINDRKLRVEQAILWGPEHRAVRDRYSCLAWQCQYVALSTALRLLIVQYRSEQKAIRIPGHSPRRLDRLRESILILRWLRYTKRAVWFPSIIRDVLG